MLAVKKRFGKEDGVVAYHGYQSFAPGEATPELAHEIGVKLARKLWGEKYQVLVSTHLDKENHLHSHFVVNTVSFVDGIRYHRTGKDYYEMRTVSDELCREYGLSVVEKPQLGKSKHYGEWRAEQEQRPTWRGLIRSEIDELIRKRQRKAVYYLLRQKGYAVKFGRTSPCDRPERALCAPCPNFGRHNEDGIRRRILSQPLPQVPHPEAPKERKKVYSMGKWQKMRKITGFRALYLYYCYKLGVFQSAARRTGTAHFFSGRI
ncbi:MAG: relaxase/mobilization nuclease domain-containing protein [Oscillospiraceae bacterium]